MGVEALEVRGDNRGTGLPGCVETPGQEGIVLRYGQFYGPGTFHPDAPPPPPRIAIDEAARRTLDVLGAEAGVVTVTDGEA